MYPYKELPVGKEVELVQCQQLLELQERTNYAQTKVRPRTWMHSELSRIWWELEYELNMVGYVSHRTMAMYAPYYDHA